LLRDIITKSFSGACLADTEFGGSMCTASDGFGFVVRMKKDNSKKATSHIAVMSTFVLFRGIFGLDILKFLFFTYLISAQDLGFGF